MKKVGESINTSIKVKIQENLLIPLKEILTKEYNIFYFYPKDETPGCTVEACEFRDANDMIISSGANLFGVSKDSVKSHNDFKLKYKLNFELLSDEDLVLNNEFGALVEKSMYGKTYMGTQRSTFIIDNTGKILFVWEKVTPNGHSFEVLAELSKLKL